MLAAFALIAGRNFNQRMAAFAVAFGLWDISFYAFLKLMIHWPDSLNTWDILFLIPLPWIGPVLAPVLVSAALIVCGLISLIRGGIPARLPHWLFMIAGGLVVILSFVWDFRNVIAGGEPLQLASVLAGRAQTYRLSRCIKESRISGISNTARFLIAAALARNRA